VYTPRNVKFSEIETRQIICCHHFRGTNKTPNYSIISLCSV